MFSLFHQDRSDDSKISFCRPTLELNGIAFGQLFLYKSIGNLLFGRVRLPIFRFHEGTLWLDCHSGLAVLVEQSVLFTWSLRSSAAVRNELLAPVVVQRHFALVWSRSVVLVFDGRLRCHFAGRKFICYSECCKSCCLRGSDRDSCRCCRCCERSCCISPRISFESVSLDAKEACAHSRTFGNDRGRSTDENEKSSVESRGSWLGMIIFEIRFGGMHVRYDNPTFQLCIIICIAKFCFFNTNDQDMLMCPLFTLRIRITWVNALKLNSHCSCVGCCQLIIDQRNIHLMFWFEFTENVSILQYKLMVPWFRFDH